jgi:hypothetical protein
MGLKPEALIMLRLSAAVALLLCCGAAIDAVSASSPLFTNFATLDCAGGLHVGVGTPAEVNVNLQAVVTLLNTAAEGIISRAKCAW